VKILKEETFKPKITGIPSAIPANATIQGHQKLKYPIVLKDSPAIKTIRNELEERKERLLELEKLGQFPNRQEVHRKRIEQLEKALSGKFYEEVRETLNISSKMNEEI